MYVIVAGKVVFHVIIDLSMENNLQINQQYHWVTNVVWLYVETIVHQY